MIHQICMMSFLGRGQMEYRIDIKDKFAAKGAVRHMSQPKAETDCWEPTVQPPEILVDCPCCAVS